MISCFVFSFKVKRFGMKVLLYFVTKDEELWTVHLANEHQCTPLDLEDEQGVSTPRVNSQGKVKTFKCKKCDAVFNTKEVFWIHSRSHIKPEKMLHCAKCIFVTEFKVRGLAI